MMMKFKILLLALPLLIAACSDSPSDSGPPPAVQSVAVDSAGPIFRYLAITLARPAGVQVTYWEDGESKLRVIADSTSATHRIFLPRLRAGRTFHYEVQSIGSGGAPGTAVMGDLRTSALPADLAALTITAQGTPTEPLTMIELMITTTGYNGALIADEEGQIVWFWRTRSQINGVSKLANGDFVMLEDSGLVVLSPDARVRTRLVNGSDKPYGLIHHDALVTSTNTVLFLARDTRIIRDTSVVGEAIWEWNPASGAVTKKWTAFDHFDWTRDRGAQSAPPNWMHANSLMIGPRGNIVVSLRNMDEVFSISSDYRTIEWRLGGNFPTLAMAPADKFWSQHSAVELPNNRLLLFDNGFSPITPRGWSRAIEYQLDLNARTATRVWEYRPQPDIFATRVGSVARLSNGNTVVAFGWGQGANDAYPITVREISSGGQLVSALNLSRPQFDRVYRMKPMKSIAGETVVR
jgi:hypothetical protein